MKTVPQLSCALLLLASTLRAQEPETVSLAVGDLAAQGVKESEAAVISEQLRVELMRSPRVRLIERSQMKAILEEQGFQQSGCTSDACAVEAGQLLGVKNFVVGSVGKAGSYTILAVRVLDVSTGEVIVNESVRTKGGIDGVLETGVATAAQSLLAGLFPETAPTAAPSAPRKNPKLRKAVLFGAGGAVLVGGGVAAVLLLTKEDDPDETPANNTRITLP